jgi:hypothetical protein
MHKPECVNCGYEWQVKQLTLPPQRSQ